MQQTTRAARPVLFSGLLVFHLGALAVFLVGWSPVAVATCLLLGPVRALGITLGYHRYFAHRSFRTGRVMQFLLALLGTSAGQGSLHWWVSHHRDHHKHSDQQADLHSPVAHSFARGHVSWLLVPESFGRGAAQVRDIEKYPELNLLDRYYGVAMFLQGAALFGLGALLQRIWPESGTNGWQMLVWGFFVSITLLLHVTFAVNSVCHRFGSQPFRAGDNSRNNALVGILAMGEGWHNNHHAFPYSARHGLRRWQFDLSWHLIQIMTRLGLVWDAKQPRPDDVEQRAA